MASLKRKHSSGGPDEFVVTRRSRLMSSDTLESEPGVSGDNLPEALSHTGKCIGVFTSGGDSSGMNGAVRAVARMGIYLGCKVYLIREGYLGMVEGGNNIVEASWAAMSGIIGKGGTIIGTARCKEFRTREGRLRAAKNLVQLGISNLVCIGGDGSLTGANLFRNEWADLLAELFETGAITESQQAVNSHLNIVGILGSIDNDFCGTDMTIGTDSALHRIIEAVDSIVTTAASDQKCFVLEVMGRNCGYLALVAAMACEADFVFIPEFPHQDDWEDKLCKKLKTERSTGQRLNMIFVAEGAIDLKGNPITAQQIVQLVKTRLDIEIRMTVLGHVQRGGRPSAFDRILGTRMGAEAVLTLLNSAPDSPAVVISLDGNQIVRKQLMKCVEKTLKVQTAMKELRFDDCVKARGRSFEANLSMYKTLSRLDPPKSGCNADTCPKSTKFAVLAVGAPACGANAAVRSFVRMSLVQGYRVFGVYDSLSGLVEGNVKQLNWPDVYGWAGRAGSVLGTKRCLPHQIGLAELAAAFKKFDIGGLLVVGGFEAFQTVYQFYSARPDYPEFKVPMIVVPSTISNNVPGTDYSLGCDTSLNEIVSICDRIKLSAIGSKRRVFIVETMGGYCGYLATLAAIAGGADAAYINEEEFTSEQLVEDCKHLCWKMDNSEIKRGLVLMNERANSNYTANFVHKLFSESGKKSFTSRLNILGHMQQGGSASPFDRILGTKLGTKAAQKLINLCVRCTQSDGRVVAETPNTAVLIGVVRRQTIFTPVSELNAKSNSEKRRPEEQWWMPLRPLLRILAKHSDDYLGQAEDDTVLQYNHSANSPFISNHSHSSNTS